MCLHSAGMCTRLCPCTAYVHTNVRAHTHTLMHTDFRYHIMTCKTHTLPNCTNVGPRSFFFSPKPPVVDKAQAESTAKTHVMEVVHVPYTIKNCFEDMNNKFGCEPYIILISPGLNVALQGSWITEISSLKPWRSILKSFHLKPLQPVTV